MIKCLTTRFYAHSRAFATAVFSTSGFEPTPIGMTRHLFRLFPALLLLVASSAAASDFVHFDFEQSIYTEPPEPILDHCVVEQNGVYHLFYLRGNPAVNIGHATSTDFVHWQTQTPVLAPGTWDNQALWAPYIISPSPGNWFMYYTGVNTLASESTGLAFSTDLNNWTKWPDPIYHPDPSWAEWSDSTFCHGRDPHVLWDNGHYYLFVTAKTNNNQGAVACAVSDDLIHWQDIGPIFINDSWHVMESVFILKHNGKYDMFFTEETVNGTTEMTSDSLLTGWDAATKRVVDQGHAPQITPTPWGDMFSRHAVYADGQGNYHYAIRFTPIFWSGDTAVIPNRLPLLGTWTFSGGDAFYYQPTWGNNPAVRGVDLPKTFVGDGWIDTYEYYTGPLGFGLPGSTRGDGTVGTMQSPSFVIQGNSMNLLVGGGNYPDLCYVALVDQTSGTVLFKETGRNSDAMDRRYWDLRADRGKTVYVEVSDQSTDPFGHICVDDINESADIVYGGSGYVTGQGTGRSHQRPGTTADAPIAVTGDAPRAARLFPNVPNPFNPTTRIAFEIPRGALVHLEIYDARGARVRTLVDATRGPGRYTEVWDGRDDAGSPTPSGIYFCRLEVGGRVIDTHKMALLK